MCLELDKVQVNKQVNNWWSLLCSPILRAVLCPCLGV